MFKNSRWKSQNYNPQLPDIYSKDGKSVESGASPHARGNRAREKNFSNKTGEPGVAVCPRDLSTWENEEGKSQANPAYRMRPCFKKENVELI